MTKTFLRHTFTENIFDIILKLKFEI